MSSTALSSQKARSGQLSHLWLRLKRLHISTQSVLVVLTFITALLRWVDIDARSIWLDESFTLLRIWDTWGAMFANLVHRQGIPTTDIHPFGYFAMLKVWAMLIGNSSFSLRLFSAVGAVLVVPLTWVVARRFLGKPASLLAVGLAVLSPSSQWFSGELRMYAWLPALALINLYYFTRAIQTPQRRWWVYWSVAAIVGLLVHYSMACLVAGQALITGIWLLHRRILSLRIVLITAATALALVIFVALSNVGVIKQIWDSVQKGFFAAADMNALVLEVLNGTVFGLNAADPTGQALLWLFAALGFVGVVLSRHWLLRAFAIYIFIAFFMWWALSLVISNRPTFRYLVFLVPLLQILPCVIVDRALSSRSKSQTQPASLFKPVIAALVTLIVVGLTTFGTVWSFIRTRTWQDDWRSVARTIREHWQEGDVIVGNLYIPEAALIHELSDLPIRFLPSRYIRESGLGDSGHQWLRERTQRIWYANAGDQDFGQGSELDAPLVAITANMTPPRAPVLRQRYNYAGRSRTVALQLIDLQPWQRDALPTNAQATPADSQPTNNAAIVGYTLAPGNGYANSPSAKLSVFWRYDRNDLEPVAKHKLTLRLRHGENTWWTWQFPAQLILGNDTNPIQRVDYTLPLPLGLPKLPYQIVLEAQQGDKAEVYQHAEMALPDPLLNCCVRVTHWPPEANNTLAPNSLNLALQTISPLASALNAPPGVPVQFQPVRPAAGANGACAYWRGSDIALAAAEYPERIRYGETLPVVLTWCALSGTPAAEWETRLSLRSLLSEVADTRKAAGDPAFPTGQWASDEPVRDPYALTLPSDLATGYYRLVLERYRAEQRLEQVTLGLVQVIGYEPTPLPAPIPKPVDGSAGELRLLGYGGPERWTRGVGIDIHTYWQASATTPRDGVLFLHIMGPNGKLIAQDDNIPENGQRHTATYRSGETLDQTHRVILPLDAPGGEYKLYAGVYDRNKDCCRWEVSQNGQRPPDDLIDAGSFVLEPLPNTKPYANNLFLPMLLQAVP